jgi:hypothetical protein
MPTMPQPPAPGLSSIRPAISRRGFGRWLAAAAAAATATTTSRATGPRLPLFDAHIHYSHDAWELVPPAQAVGILRQAGLQGALVSSSNDRGTQMLVEAAPDIVVPELRPYRSRGEIGSWMHDASVVPYLEDRLQRLKHVGIGEFHLYGADADLAVPRRMVALAREQGLLLHAHSDLDCIERLLKQWPEARVLWAHSGFERPEPVRQALRRHPRLSCDLAFRGDHASGGQVDAGWREAFEEFPDRFMVGTDTFTPERWHYIGPHADGARAWLASLPPALAERIGWRNGVALVQAVRRAG